MPKVRKGQAPGKLSRAEFKKRFDHDYVDSTFDPEREALGRIEAIAWHNYQQSRKAPHTRKAGAGYADPDYDLSAEWIEAKERIGAARKRQHERFKARPKITCNARMGTRELKEHCTLDETTKGLLQCAMTDLNLSARAYDRILKVARTIADLAAMEKIAAEHVSEAIQFRSLDRQLWS